MTDNYLILAEDSDDNFEDSDDNFGTVSIALRFHFKSQAAINFGAWTPIIGDLTGVSPAIPFASLILPFGKNRSR